MANVTSVLATAQKVYLNDAAQKNWTKQQLIPFLQEAHRQLQLELNLNGIQVIKQQSVVVVVPKIPDLTTWPGYVLMPSQPSNIITPIACFERPTSDNLNSDWDEMVPKSFPPKVEPVNDLVYWSFMQDKIVFVGALQDNQVMLQFNGGIPIPSADADDMGFTNAETYIAPKLAALASASIGGDTRAARNEKIAEVQLEKILSYSVLAEQGMVSRRKPYRHVSVPFVIR